MKSIIHFHNNIFVKTAGFVILTLLTACYGIQSQFGKNGITQNKKVCFTGYINSNPARLFMREFQSVYGEHQIPDCDYLVYAMFTEGSARQASMSGMEYFEKQTMSVMYSIYEFEQNTNKIQKVQEIIDNPTMITHETYTESFGRGAIASRMNNLTRRKNNSVLSYQNTYKKDKQRFADVLKIIGGGSYSGYLNTQKNPVVLTAETQAQEDAYEFMAKSLSRKVINGVSLNIDKHLNPVDVEDNKDDDKIEKQIEQQDTEDVKIDNVNKNQQQEVQHNKTIRKISDVIK